MDGADRAQLQGPHAPAQIRIVANCFKDLLGKERVSADELFARCRREPAINTFCSCQFYPSTEESDELSRGMYTVSYDTGALGGPGGKVENRETILDAINREMREETGYAGIEGEGAGAIEAGHLQGAIFDGDGDLATTFYYVKYLPLSLLRTLVSGRHHLRAPNLGEVAAVVFPTVTLDRDNARIALPIGKPNFRKKCPALTMARSIVGLLLFFRCFPHLTRHPHYKMRLGENPSDSELADALAGYVVSSLGSDYAFGDIVKSLHWLVAHFTITRTFIAHAMSSASVPAAAEVARPAALGVVTVDPAPGNEDLSALVGSLRLD